MRYLILLAALLIASPALGSTVTFTDPDTGEATSVQELHESGSFHYRIQTGPKPNASMATQSVEVTDSTGQVAPACHPVGNDMTISVTTEVVANAVPVVLLNGKSYSNDDCTGQVSILSNPIIVEFVPEAPGLLAPLAP